MSLEKITLFFDGKIFFTSSAILSTPGPLNTKSQFPSLLTVSILIVFYIHNNDTINFFYIYEKLNL